MASGSAHIKHRRFGACLPLAMPGRKYFIVFKFMHYPWMIIALLVIWISTILLLVINQSPNADWFLGGAIVLTIILTCIGFLTS
ncbi:MAG: hypothetical protein HYV76_01115 [Candidatus Vogelbacteria bacterium]|nr:hypothetical protein [Candidatus Vogelbacteria bacterium]